MMENYTIFVWCLVYLFICTNINRFHFVNVSCYSLLLETAFCIGWTKCSTTDWVKDHVWRLVRCVKAYWTQHTSIHNSTLKTMLQQEEATFQPAERTGIRISIHMASIYEHKICKLTTTWENITGKWVRASRRISRHTKTAF